ncbi:Hypothetical predicted protein [Octopus vulgaris]|uniref:Uncharacterized protein n=3 Tax=Octopus TaxID=6643 RepID=A0AA36B6R9_OCTVU|nr:Hypothetical predicted protein [Octopus vulgaris]
MEAPWKILAVNKEKHVRLHLPYLIISKMSAKGKINVEKWDPNADGELNEVNLRKKLKKKGCNCLTYEYPPGTVFCDHTYGHSKKDAILTGQYEVFMYGQKAVLQPGDMIDIPANTIHNTAVVGNKFVQFFDASVIY